MILLSLISYVLVQTLGLFIAFAAAAVLLYMILRRFHSRAITLTLCAVFIGISIFFYVPNGLPSGFEYAAYRATYGPAGKPSLPFWNVIAFFRHFNAFERVADIAHDPNQVGEPIARTATSTVHVDIVAKEVISELAPGVYQNFWTYNGTVPGPMVRVRVGDTVVVTLKNDESSLHPHTIDFHAVIGPGGGAAVLLANPGETKTLTFTALHPGLFVYHCAAQNPAVHMAHGQYGLILVEPETPLPPVDHEYYVMQGEFYTTGTLGQKGLQIFDSKAMLDGIPNYVVFNGRTGALAKSLNAKSGETVRFYVGNGGVNLISSFHIIGTVFDRVWQEGSITSPPVTNVQTTLVPAGGSTVVDLTLRVPGNFVLVDHALARVDKGAWGVLHVTGDPEPGVFQGQAQEMKGH
jgi:nitrite reductase (NO-forming)